MSLSRRDMLKLAGVAGAAAVAPRLAGAQALEKKDVVIAVGGQALIYYLPLSIAHVNGYFKDEGLDAKIVDFAGGSKALQAVVGGSADVVSGAFEHTINLQSKGQAYRAFAQQGHAPMIVLAVSKKTMAGYKSPADLKGKKVGVTAPGSSTNMMVSFYLAQHGLKPTDVSIVGVGAGAGAITAMRTGQIDAIANLDPVISTLVKEDAVQIVADTRTIKDTIQIFGGNMPSGCLYTSQEFIDKNPNTVQALANAIVRADKWIQASTPDQIAKVVPEGYLLGDVELYKLALQGNKEALSPDGRVPEDGPQTALNALAAFVPNFPKDKIDVTKIWTNDFVNKANQKYPNA
ncbi:ABC transporter substrate-binding protein [Alcaligenaceae bacterium]|nr:ABC transporter substrate-binding protein [Alcaligenaceae bacterium]